MVRISAASLCLVAALAVLTGCSLGPNGELRKIVDGVAPPDSSLNCEWGSSSFENEPKSWYGCWNYVPGKLKPVARTFKSRLAKQGFVVSSHRYARSVQLTGVRGARTLCVDILGPGFVSGRNTSPAEVNPPRGQVFVDIWTVELPEAPAGAGIPPCAALPAFPE
jgi:hypothetical protein